MHGRVPRHHRERGMVVPQAGMLGRVVVVMVQDEAELLARLLARAPIMEWVPAGAPPGGSPRGGPWLWVDGVEYLVRVYHVHDAIAGQVRCATCFSVDLAPHVDRAPGRHDLALIFPEATLTTARDAPVGVVPTVRGELL